jgi:tRNA 2-thiouridine synthesizing protein E
MPFIEIGKTRYEVDGNGFFKDHTKWSDGVAHALAKGPGVTLTPRHMQLIRFLRAFYAMNGKLPRVRELCVDLPTSIRELYALFPAGLSLACKFGGLPRPGCG